MKSLNVFLGAQMLILITLLGSESLAYSGCEKGGDYRTAGCTFADSEIELCYTKINGTGYRCMLTPDTTGYCYKGADGIVYRLGGKSESGSRTKKKCVSISLVPSQPACVVTIKRKDCPFLAKVFKTSNPIERTISSVSSSKRSIHVFQNGFADINLVKEIDLSPHNANMKVFTNWTDPVYYSTSEPQGRFNLLFPYTYTNMLKNAEGLSSSAVAALSSKKNGYYIEDVPKCRKVQLEVDAADPNSPQDLYQDADFSNYLRSSLKATVVSASEIGATDEACCTGEGLPEAPAGYRYESRAQYWQDFCTLNHWQFKMYTDGSSTSPGQVITSTINTSLITPKFPEASDKKNAGKQKGVNVEWISP